MRLQDRRDYVRRHWKYKEPGAAGCGNGCDTSPHAGPATPAISFDRRSSHSLCISGMAFQDAWNIDLERLQRCCVHVATAQGKLVPFCAYYLTDSRGRRLMDRDEPAIPVYTGAERVVRQRYACWEKELRSMHLESWIHASH